MKKATLSLSIGLALLGSAAMAKPAYMGTVKSTYKLTGPAASAVKCATCHVGAGPALNPYGKGLQAVQAKMKLKAVTPAVLKKLDAVDSDKDGKKDGAEIKAGTNPGDPKSK